LFQKNSYYRLFHIQNHRPHQSCLHQDSITTEGIEELFPFAASPKWH